MEGIVELPSCNKGLHFGITSATRDFQGSYFEDASKNIIARIISIRYNPDENYCKFDGYHGKCWEALLYDFREKDNNENTLYKKITYKFRDIPDLIMYYKNAGYIFIDARY